MSKFSASYRLQNEEIVDCAGEQDEEETMLGDFVAEILDLFSQKYLAKLDYNTADIHEFFASVLPNMFVNVLGNSVNTDDTARFKEYAVFLADEIHKRMLKTIDIMILHNLSGEKDNEQ